MKKISKNEKDHFKNKTLPQLNLLRYLQLLCLGYINRSL